MLIREDISDRLSGGVILLICVAGVIGVISIVYAFHFLMNAFEHVRRVVRGS